MIDTIVVGRYVSMDALAAIGATSSLVFLIFGFINGITSGCSIITAQRYGAKDEDGVRTSFACSIVINLFITIIFTFIGIVASYPLLELLQTPSDIIDLSHTYLVIIYGGAITTCCYNVLSSAIRALGDSRTPLYFLIISGILNIILDLLFTIVFPWGIAGVAYATVIAQAVSGILCFIYMQKKFPLLCISKKDFRLTKDIIFLHLKTAIPMAVQFSITSLGFMAVQGSLNQFGSSTIAAYTAAGKVEQFVTLPFSTFGVTMATYTAQNLGAGYFDRIRKGVFQCFLLSFGVALLGLAISYLFAEPILSLFISQGNESIMADAVHYLHIVSLFFPLLGVIFVYRNSLQGIGITLLPLVVSLVELAVRGGVSYTLPNILGYTGICLASPISWIFASSIIYVRYRIWLTQKKKEFKMSS